MYWCIPSISGIFCVPWERFLWLFSLSFSFSSIVALYCKYFLRKTFINILNFRSGLFGLSLTFTLILRSLHIFHLVKDHLELIPAWEIRLFSGLIFDILFRWEMVCVQERRIHTFLSLQLFLRDDRQRYLISIKLF